jgi:hypothetical protein
MLPAKSLATAPLATDAMLAVEVSVVAPVDWRVLGELIASCKAM